jgi:glucosamine--fructose-6-phosphate aminotransferase (isomerizing)
VIGVDLVGARTDRFGVPALLASLLRMLFRALLPPLSLLAKLLRLLTPLDDALLTPAPGAEHERQEDYRRPDCDHYPDPGCHGTSLPVRAAWKTLRVAGEETRRAIFAQPAWLRKVPTELQLLGGQALYTGCGTSFHAAQTGGWAEQALELVLRPRRADVLVAVSHEGDTPLTLEAARAFDGPVWLVTGKPDSPLGQLAHMVVIATPEVERSWCHTASYTCAVAALAALRGEDISLLPGAVEEALDDREPVSEHERFLITGAGRDWPTAQEAALKLREGAFVAAEAHQTEQLLHGHLAAVDESVRAFVLEGEGRAAERAAGAAAALQELGCETTLVPTVHPAVDIVRFQLLTLDLAEARGVDPDRIRRDDPRWERARAVYD